MVCQECGVNPAIVGAHYTLCSRYLEPDAEPEPTVDEAEQDHLLETFSNALTDVVIDRGEKTLLIFFKSIGVTEDDPGFEEVRQIAQMCIALGAGMTVQVLVEQDVIDGDNLRRAAGL